MILVGDAPYYTRFGFFADLTADLAMPAKVDPARFLAVELREGALAGAAGAVTGDVEMVRGIALMTGEAWRVAA